MDKNSKEKIDFTNEINSGNEIGTKYRIKEENIDINAKDIQNSRDEINKRNNLNGSNGSKVQTESKELNKQKKVKIDYKLSELEKWVKKYPDLKIVHGKMENFRKYAKTNEEYENLVALCGKMQEYYDYIRVRISRGKAGKKLIEKCRQMDIGGIFGYSDKVKELAKKYGRTEEEAKYIYYKYGSLENMYNKYKNNELFFDQDENILFKKSFVLDIDNNEDKGYENLVVDIVNHIKKKEYDSEFSNYSNVIFYSSNRIKELLSNFSEKEQKIINERYGINNNGNEKRPKDIAKDINATNSYVGQVVYIVRNKISDKTKYEKALINFDEIKNDKMLTDEEKSEFKKIQEIADDYRISNSELSDEEKLYCINTFLKNYHSILLRKKIYGNDSTTDGRHKIDDVCFSYDTLYRLKRMGIKYLEEISTLNSDDLYWKNKIGPDNVYEINEKLEKYGMKLKDSPVKKKKITKKQKRLNIEKKEEEKRKQEVIDKIIGMQDTIENQEKEIEILSKEKNKKKSKNRNILNDKKKNDKDDFER